MPERRATDRAYDDGALRPEDSNAGLGVRTLSLLGDTRLPHADWNAPPWAEASCCIGVEHPCPVPVNPRVNATGRSDPRFAKDLRLAEVEVQLSAARRPGARYSARSGSAEHGAVAQVRSSKNFQTAAGTKAGISWPPGNSHHTTGLAPQPS